MRHFTHNPVETPSFKLQAPAFVKSTTAGKPEKLQSSNSKNTGHWRTRFRSLEFGFWSLGFPWCLVLGAWCFAFNALASDPQVDSWLTTYSGRYARIYATDADKSSGNA